MTNTQIEHIGSFEVHESIITGIVGWEPNYWNFLSLETRENIKKETLENFRNTLLAYPAEDKEKYDPAYLNHLIIRLASQAMTDYWHRCIYEHKKREYDIQEHKIQYCGARKKNGPQCNARAIYGSGRCRHHGGKSTGPKTIDGKIKSLSKLMQYKCYPELLIEKRRQLIAEMKAETGF
jgi:hypothetical protein